MEELVISAGTSRCETNWRTLRLTWAEFATRLERPARTSETLSQYAALPPAARVRAKDVGGFVGGALLGGARRAGSVTSRCLLALDADHAVYAAGEAGETGGAPNADGIRAGDEASSGGREADGAAGKDEGARSGDGARSDGREVDGVRGAGEARFALWENWLSRYGCAAALHSTHSHTREHPRLRLLIPLRRPVAPDEYEAVARRVAFDLGIDAFDDTTYQPGRLMFWPSVCRDGEYVFRRCEGPWLDPDAVLARYADWRDTARWPVSSRQSRALSARAGRLGDPGQKPGLVGAFCRAYDVPAAIGKFLSHVYAPAREPGRYTYRAGSAYGGAVVYDGGRFLYSYHDTDPAGGRLLNAFDLVRVHLFGERDAGTPPGAPMRALPSYAAMQALCRADGVALRELAGRAEDVRRGGRAEDAGRGAQRDGRGGTSCAKRRATAVYAAQDGTVEHAVRNAAAGYDARNAAGYDARNAGTERNATRRSEGRPVQNVEEHLMRDGTGEHAVQNVTTEHAGRNAWTERSATRGSEGRPVRDGTTEYAVQNATTEYAGRNAGTERSATRGSEERPVRSETTEYAVQNVTTEYVGQNVRMERSATRGNEERPVRNETTEYAVQNTTEHAVQNVTKEHAGQNVRMERSATRGNEPRPVWDGEPCPMSGGEPRPMSDGEPRPVSGGEPRPVEDGESRPVEDGEPYPMSGGEPRPVWGGEPRPVEDGEPRPVWDGEPRPVRDGAPSPAHVSVREAAGALSRSDADYTEQGTAVAFADAYGDVLCWQDNLRWVAWDGRRWAPEAQAEATLCMMRFTDDLQARARERLARAPEGGTEAREAETALRWAVSCRSATRIGRTLRLAQALMKRHALSDFDADPWLLNTPGGMVDLRTGRLRPHDPAALCTALTRLTPAGNADAPRYTRFLYRITGGDADLCDYLQRVAGMALVGEVYEEGITICHGPGGNGKSTLFGLWQDVLGDYAGTIRPELLVPRRDSSEPFGLEQVRGKRLVVAGETDEGLGLNQSVLKRLASQDQISANPKGRDPFSFRPTHTLILHTNHLPRIRSVDEGTRRRIAVLPLTSPIGRAEMVTDFRARLLESEGPQILRWMIEGARMFYEDHMKLKKPEVVEAASREYLSGEDWLRGFLTERCVLGEDEAASGGTLYEAFHQWSLENGERFPRRSREFASALRSRGFETRHTRTGNVWAGIALREAGGEGGFH